MVLPTSRFWLDVFGLGSRGYLLLLCLFLASGGFGFLPNPGPYTRMKADQRALIDAANCWEVPE